MGFDSDYELFSSKKKILGVGSFATVFLARCKTHNKKFAVKLVIYNIDEY